MERVSKARREQARNAYEEGGRSIGRQIMYDPAAEARIWKMLSGLKLWPRWYLKAFARLYADDNPQEYERIRKRRYRKGKRLADQPAKMRATREQAARRLTAHPSKRKPKPKRDL